MLNLLLFCWICLENGFTRIVTFVLYVFKMRNQSRNENATSKRSPFVFTYKSCGNVDLHVLCTLAGVAFKKCAGVCIYIAVFGANHAHAAQINHSPILRQFIQMVSILQIQITAARFSHTVSFRTPISFNMASFKN